MQKFTKERMCKYLAEKELVAKPYFELRKLTFFEPFNQEQAQHRQSVLWIYQEQIISIFEPPTPYLNYSVRDSVAAKKHSTASIEKLTDDDEALLHDILNIKEFDELLKSANEFKRYYKLFIESENKPDWYLVRVLINDTLYNYQNRQKHYEYLVNGGLTEYINDNEVIQLSENVYRLPKENIEINSTNLDLIIYPYRAMFYKSIGEDMAASWHKTNKGKVSELEKITFAAQINEVLRDALLKGELPVYRLPTYCPVKYVSYPPNFDDLISWNDIKFILNKKMPNTSIPDKPVFMSNWKEVEQSCLEVNQRNLEIQSDNCILSIGVEQLDFNNSQNNKSCSLSTHFNNVGLTGNILSKENLFNYLSENGFTTLRTHYFKRLKYYEQNAKTPIMLTVSMCMKGEFSGFEKKLNPLMSKINNGEKLPDETLGEIKPFLLEGWKTSELDPIQKEALEINKLDLSDSGMARFLDSDYSIDSFINWLESKQLDIPHAIFKLVDEVKGWNENLNNTAIITDIEQVLTPSINNNEFEFSGLLKIPKNAGNWAFAIDDMARDLFKQNGKLPNKAEAWGQLCTSPPDGYSITVGKDKRLNMPSAYPLTQRAFNERWKRYTK